MNFIEANKHLSEEELTKLLEDFIHQAIISNNLLW